MRTFRAVFFSIIFITSLFACDGVERFEEIDLIIEGSQGPVQIRAEIARTQAEQSQGYMHRKIINDGEGMLFVNDSDRILSFWMKDTLVPLSIAFISSEGIIMEIYHMEPHNLAPVRSSRSVRHALEVPQGWFGRAGIGIGDRVILDNL